MAAATTMTLILYKARLCQGLHQHNLLNHSTKLEEPARNTRVHSYFLFEFSRLYLLSPPPPPITIVFDTTPRASQTSFSAETILLKF